jgi:hypothetical protein
MYKFLHSGFQLQHKDIIDFLISPTITKACSIRIMKAIDLVQLINKSMREDDMGSAPMMIRHCFEPSEIMMNASTNIQIPLRKTLGISQKRTTTSPKLF